MYFNYDMFVTSVAKSWIIAKMLTAANINTAATTYIGADFFISAFSLADATTYLIPKTTNITTAAAVPTT